jgi:hypothetical protein
MYARITVLLEVAACMQTAVGEVRTNSWFQLVRTKMEFGSDFQNWIWNWVLGYYNYIICV